MKNYSIRLIVTLILTLFFLHAKSQEKLDIKMVAEIQKTGYVGESIPYVVKLMSTSPDIADVRVVKYPEYPESARVIKGVTRNSHPEKIQQKGTTYYCWTIMRSFIIPEKSGKQSIGAGRFVVFIPHEKIVYHNFWGNRRTVEYEELALECKSTDIKIAELPGSKTVNEFSGCVGDFKIEGWFPPGKILTGTEAYVVFSISGYGSLADLKVPNLSKLFSKGCRLKSVEQDEEQSQREGRLFSEITLTCSFVPEEEEFEIAPLTLKFFNPESKKYYETGSDFLHWDTKPTNKKVSHSKDAIEI